MMFKYRAKRGPEDITEGRIDAQSEKEAIERLSQLGYVPIRVEKYAPIADSLSFGKSHGKVKSKQITIFSRQLASLLKSGVPILNALTTISEQSENINLRNILQEIHDSVKDGAAFSSVLAKYPHAFSPLYVALIRTGEDSGALPAALLRIADYRAKQEEMLSRFRMALAYPILMAIVGVATIIFMLTFVIPRLIQIYINLGQRLPLPTRILIFITQQFQQGWFWILIVLAIIILVIRRQVNTKAGRLSWSIFKLHIPVFGKFILKAELARFSRTLELLIKNGIPILKAINIATPVLGNEIIKNQLDKSYKEIEQGGSLGRSLKNSKLFPLFMVNLITVGEESGRLAEAFGEVATSYEEDTDEAIRIMSTLLEPLMILGMGLIVGFVVIAMLLPIFEINVIAR
jgi:general secretion pathway protein F